MHRVVKYEKCDPSVWSIPISYPPPHLAVSHGRGKDAMNESRSTGSGWLWAKRLQATSKNEN